MKKGIDIITIRRAAINAEVLKSKEYAALLSLVESMHPGGKLEKNKAWIVFRGAPPELLGTTSTPAKKKAATKKGKAG